MTLAHVRRGPRKTCFFQIDFFTEAIDMLVLSRKPGETLKIGSEITLRVLDVRGHVLKLGIEAPPDVRVLRGELTVRTEPLSEAALCS
jgi:carbon storage regulator CsrA